MMVGSFVIHCVLRTYSCDRPGVSHAWHDGSRLAKKNLCRKRGSKERPRVQRVERVFVSSTSRYSWNNTAGLALAN